MTFKLPLILNAGILEYTADTKTLKPVPTKGLLIISKADSPEEDEDDDDMGMLNFKWKPIDPTDDDKNVESIEKVLFPGEQIIIPYKEMKQSKQFSNSLIYLLTFRSGEVVPFYIQEQDPSNNKLVTFIIDKDTYKGHGTTTALNTLNDELMGVFTKIIKGDYE